MQSTKFKDKRKRCLSFVEKNISFKTLVKLRILLLVCRLCVTCCTLLTATLSN